MKKVNNLDSLLLEIQDIKHQLGDLSPEEISEILWEEAKFQRKEDPCFSYILRLGKLQLQKIVTDNQ